MKATAPNRNFRAANTEIGVKIRGEWRAGNPEFLGGETHQGGLKYDSSDRNDLRLLVGL